MKVLVTGAGGMLGTDLCADLHRRGHEVIATDTLENFELLDITDTRAVREAVTQKWQPEAIIHAAAWTHVDNAERNPDPAWRVNALGSWNVAAAAAEIGAWVVAVSTDFVFDGTKAEPYDEFDPVHPISQYGSSKEAGERLVRQTLPDRHMIARTAWLYGVHGRPTPAVFLKLGREKPEVPVVADQIGCPTHTKELSRKLIDLIENPLPGTYHICGAGSCSWYEFAREIFRQAEIDTPVVPITSDEYARQFQSPTQRPAYSVMRRRALEMRRMDDLKPWPDALADYLRLLGEI